MIPENGGRRTTLVRPGDYVTFRGRIVITFVALGISLMSSDRAELYGDPVDAMLLWDVPSYPAVVVPCRAVGVLQVEQNRVNNQSSERIRNDRILALPIEARRENALSSVDGLPVRVRRELEQFPIAATALEGKDARIVGWGDAMTALKLIRECSTLKV